MAKVNVDPNNAMIVTNEGTKTAMRMITTQMRTRIAHFNNPLAYPGRPMMLLEGGMLLTCSPQRISMDTTIGRVLLLP